jgi:hypothetical protein
MSPSKKTSKSLSSSKTKENKSADSEDSENDEDFVPTEEPMDEDEEDPNAAVDSCAPRLSAAKRKAVDEAFKRLFGYEWGTSFRAKRRRVSQDNVSRQESILSDIFGTSVAAQMLATSDSIRKIERKQVVLPSLDEVTITETKRFAGRDITVEKTVRVDQKHAARSTEEDPAARARAPKAGLDQVLAEISGPSKISTVAKTSADWDQFKTKTGMEEELEKQATGSKAYLVKKDFLQRVDERRFEKEKGRTGPETCI